MTILKRLFCQPSLNFSSEDCGLWFTTLLTPMGKFLCKSRKVEVLSSCLTFMNRRISMTMSHHTCFSLFPVNKETTTCLRSPFKMWVLKLGLSFYGSHKTGQTTSVRTSSWKAQSWSRSQLANCNRLRCHQSQRVGRWTRAHFFCFMIAPNCTLLAKTSQQKLWP